MDAPAGDRGGRGQRRHQKSVVPLSRSAMAFQGVPTEVPVDYNKSGFVGDAGGLTLNKKVVK